MKIKAEDGDSIEVMKTNNDGGFDKRWHTNVVINRTHFGTLGTNLTRRGVEKLINALQRSIDLDADFV